MERRLSSGLPGDLTAGKKKGSAISELIKYWASSSQTPPGSAPGSPSSAAQNKTTQQEPSASPAASTRQAPSDKILDISAKSSPAFLSPKIAPPVSLDSEPKKIDEEAAKVSATPTSPPSEGQTENIVKDQSSKAEPATTQASTAAESSPISPEPVKDTAVQVDGNDGKSTNTTISDTPSAEPKSAAEPEPKEVLKPEPEVASTPSDDKEKEKPIVEPLKIDEAKPESAPEASEPRAASPPGSHRQFIVTVTKVERRGGRKHATTVETQPPDSPKAEHFLPPSGEAEDDEITQKLKKKRDQFLQRRMSSVRIPSQNYREVSPIAAAMGYDSTMSHDEIEDEIDYHAVTVGHKKSNEDPDFDYYYDSSEDEELPIESPSNVESVMRQHSHKRAVSDGKQVAEMARVRQAAAGHAPTPSTSAASFAAPETDSAGQRKVVRTPFSNNIRDRQDSIYEAPVAIGSKPPKRPKYTGPAVSALRDAQRIIREGVLLKKGRRGRWKRRYIVLDKKRIYIYENAQEIKIPKQIIPLSFAHCRSTPQTKDQKHYQFDLLTPDKKYELRADSKLAVSEWAQVIQSVCDNTMLDQLGDLSSTSEGGEARAENKELMEIRSLPGNSVCADCEAPTPEWASLNLGTFLCIECSGIHRSLGVHISKVRSLTLDKWDKEQVEFMRKMGNINANAIWEKHVPSYRQKPTPKSTLEERKFWIHSKYVKRDFFDRTREAEFPSPPEKSQLGAVLPEGLEDLKTCILEILRVDADFRNQVRFLLMAEEANGLKKSSSGNQIDSPQGSLKRSHSASRTGEEEVITPVRRSRKDSSMKRSASAADTAGAGTSAAGDPSPKERRRSRRLSTIMPENPVEGQ
eukprot:TRINITY_DN5108_c0_g1_i1.p1 TRINITY_DN5108_c0_g1~~TRINITY_DN5108_c0_g1_i1.p1  ORF type:complete len:859 (+),score=164.18 TRINITY_DN5108_c0_g1_i1:2804-5380(+)